MTSIPSDAWFCEQCQLRGVPQSRQAREEEEERARALEKQALLSQSQSQGPRGRGRPSVKAKPVTIVQSSSLTRLKGSGSGLLRSASGQSIGATAAAAVAAAVVVNEPDVVSVRTALDFINAKTDPSFTASEKAILEQLRRWAPLCDLKIVLDTLARKNMEFTTTAK